MSNVYICDLLKIHFRLILGEDQFFAASELGMKGGCVIDAVWSQFTRCEGCYEGD